MNSSARVLDAPPPVRPEAPLPLRSIRRTGEMRAILATLRLPPAAGLAAMLLLVDIALITAHLMRAYTGTPESAAFDLGLDRGYGEFLQYAKCVWAILLLGMLFARIRSAVFVVWAVVFAYLAVDDALQVHERVGGAIRSRIPGEPESAQHLGELGFFVLIGMLVVGVVLLLHRRTPPFARSVSTTLLALLAALAFCGVVFDAIGALFLQGTAWSIPLTVLEDGGETLVMTAVVVLLFAVALCGPPSASGACANGERAGVAST